MSELRTKQPYAGMLAILEMRHCQNSVFQRTSAPEANIVALLPALVERASPLTSTRMPGAVVVSMVVSMVITMVVSMIIAVVITMVVPMIITVVIPPTVQVLGPTALPARVTTAAPMIFRGTVIRLGLVVVLGKRRPRQHRRTDACQQETAV